MENLIGISVVWAIIGQFAFIIWVDGKRLSDFEGGVYISLFTGPIGLCLLLVIGFLVKTYRLINP